jgi:hypothetical protein
MLGYLTKNYFSNGRAEVVSVEYSEWVVRASPAVLSKQPCKNIFHIQVQLFTTNSEPAGPIIMIGQSEKLMNSQITFITLFCARAERRCCAFCNSNSKLCSYVESKQLFLSQTSTFWLFFPPILTVQHHIRSASWRFSEWCGIFSAAG